MTTYGNNECHKGVGWASTVPTTGALRCVAIVLLWPLTQCMSYVLRKCICLLGSLSLDWEHPKSQSYCGCMQNIYTKSMNE